MTPPTFLKKLLSHFSISDDEDEESPPVNIPESWRKPTVSVEVEGVPVVSSPLPLPSSSPTKTSKFKFHKLKLPSFSKTSPPTKPFTKSTQKIHIPFLRRGKRLLAGFLFIINLFFGFSLLPGSTFSFGLFLLLNSFLLLDYLWKTSHNHIILTE